jgi:cell division protease FtsH
MDLIKQITERKEKLKQAKANLKGHFIGLDDQIDHVFDMIETWYAMPELITRPVIVNIWGMTGTGKTDLIRRLARELGMLNKFFELQMDTKKTSWVTSIEESFDMAGIEENEPAIVLFDEMQRFRTKNRDGENIDNDMYQDIWMLLSDGTFANNAGKMNKIQAMLFEEMYSKERSDWEKKQEDEWEEEDEEIPEELAEIADELGLKFEAKVDARRKRKKKKRKLDEPNYKFKNTFWSSKSLKKRLKLDESVEEIMKWSPEKKIKVIRQRSHDDLVNKGADYNKLLIFVCGNLDEAYSMANDVDEVDIDADVFHEFSKKINLVDIKHALTRRFQPEQIARLGNNHVIYPAMSKQNFVELIERTIKISSEEFKKLSGVDLEIDQTVMDAVYRNGVFPTQGVRPIFTTISSLYEANMPSFLIAAVEAGSKKMKIEFDSETDSLVGIIENDKSVRKRVKCDIDASKKKRNIDSICKTAIHEAGHATLYCALFGVAPTQISAASTSVYRSGFMMNHKHGNDKETISNIIKVCYGGQLAETMIFGKALTTGGCSADISTATFHAHQMVRVFEQDTRIGKISDFEGSEGRTFITDISGTNKNIEEILEEQKKIATDLLNKHAQFHLALSKSLLEKHKLEQEEIVEIAAKYGVIAEAKDSSYELCPRYVEKFEQYKKKINESE